MTGDEITAEIGKTKIAVHEFIETSKKATPRVGTFDDWTEKDIVAHITGWMNYSAQKLQKIRNNVQYGDIVSPDEFNIRLYYASRDLSIEEVQDNFSTAIRRYIETIKQYSDEELPSKQFNTGFSFELWRYMMLDGVIHPNRHLIYHYLKRQDFPRLISLLDQKKNTFEVYSGGKINIYDFGEFNANTQTMEASLDAIKNRYMDNEILVRIYHSNYRGNTRQPP